DSTRSVIRHEPIEEAKRRLHRPILTERLDIRPGGLPPALGLVAIHLLRDLLVRDGNGAGTCPDRVAVCMIAVMMRIEDEAHRELSHLANVCEAGFGAV